MAQKDIDIEKESPGRFERVLLILIPIVFTVVLLGVLATLFNVDMRNSMLEWAGKIPVVNKWIPDPAADPEKDKLKESKEQVKSANATINELKNELSTKETDLQKANADKAQQDAKIKDLQTQLDEKQQSELNGEAEQEDAYEKQIKDLAKMYADMSPSKAAPILQSMTTEEMVQLLSSMKADNRVAILEKMDPKIAADVTMKLKDTVSSSDLAIAALQSRLEKDKKESEKKPEGLDQTQISQTFASMPPKSAATLILNTYKISPDKALTILKSVTDATRSSIMDSMSSQDSKTTAVILNKLMSK